MKIAAIISREYKQIVKKKSFIIATILTPALMAAFIFVPMLLTKVGREEKVINVTDYSGVIHKEFIERSEKSKYLKEKLKLTFRYVEDNSSDQRALLKEYEAEEKKTDGFEFKLAPKFKKMILEKKIDGMLIIPASIVEKRQIYYCAQNISDFETNKYINTVVHRVLSSKILRDNIDDPEIVGIVQNATADIKPNLFVVKEEGTTKSSSTTAYMMSIFMLTILFSVLMGYGQLIMRGVIEEKNNRIVEVLISSTNTQSLFYGKIIGIGLAGLTQVGIWMLMGWILMGKFSLGIDRSVLNFLTPQLGIYFVLFFIIGYFMYAILFSIVGASVNTDQEAQQYAAPITYLLIIPFMIGIMVTQNPNTPLVIATSLFPLFTPTLMFMRISVAPPAFSQILLSIILSMGFTVFLAWLGAKIFRVGILMYGKKPSMKEIIKWIRYR
ncbi:MAG: ABC transporter permease [Acidobacteriota bacterium]